MTETVSPTFPAAGSPDHRSISRRRRFGWITLLGANGRIGMLGLALLTLLTFVGSRVTDAPRSDPGQIALGPSSEHWLGTDLAGRDNLLLAIHGGEYMLVLAFVAGLLTMLIAAFVGGIGGAVGGIVDRVTVWITDLWLTMPRFVLLLVIAGLFRIRSNIVLAVVLAIFGWPALARQIRSAVLSLREREYVEAARLIDLGWFDVIVKQILPAMAPFIVISTIQAMTQAIYQQVGLAFLGLVPLTDNWGVLFSVSYAQNAIYSPTAAYSVLTPVVAIVALQVSLVFTSRGLEEALTPTLRSDR